ncbi:MAG TPA: helix-turn-helix transcriptional regulator [Opitutaceae bacterium]|jgi:transcriptional regulator with XRE-family HTH domain|nr:helix-turn-helix transcriptional regulator [Opitutaceae bacterium]
MPVTESALKKFGANVRTKRDEKELSQEKLAELADLDRTYISSVERGARNISLLSTLRIAKALKMSVSELCEGID